MMMPNPVILLVLLCCVVGYAAAEDQEFRCLYDEVAKNSGEMPASIIESEADSGKVKGVTMSGDTAKWEAIRFKVFSEDLNDASLYCTARDQQRPTFTAPSQVTICKEIDILTNDKKSTLLNRMIPSALKLHSDRLLVQRVSGKIKVPAYSEGFCAVMTVPQSHKNSGVADVDMIMYTAAGPTGSASAWAGPCSRGASGRFVVGFMNVGPAIIGTEEKNIRVATHEIAHALGFGFENMESLKMVEKIYDIRGHTRQVVTSSTTRKKARAYYNCSRIPGMELENEGGEGTALSHWERRNAKDELMAGVAGIGYYTALTLAAFEDMKFYRANWGTEEKMEWGHNKGCDFLEGKCLRNEKPVYPDMFCSDPKETRVCSFRRRGLGKCAVGKYTSVLPGEFQYFGDPKMGGTAKLLDYCPIVEEFANAGCKDGDVKSMPGSRVGPNSLCLKGEGLRMKGHEPDAVQDVCAEVSCKDKVVRVRYAGNNKWHDCSEEGKVTPKGSFTAGQIVCPSFEEVCGRSDGVASISCYFLHFVLLWAIFLVL